MISLVVAGSLSAIPSKAAWYTVGNNVNMARVVQNNKRNWCWAYSGVKMLECLGINNMQAVNVAISARHTAASDNPEGLGAALQAVKNLLPQGHAMERLNLLTLRNFNNNSGELARIDRILNIRINTPNGAMPLMATTVLNANVPEVIFIVNSLRRGIPVLASINNGRHVVLITGLEPNMNQIRYWDVNRGEVTENFANNFTNNRVAYATLG